MSVGNHHLRPASILEGGVDLTSGGTKLHNFKFGTPDCPTTQQQQGDPPVRPNRPSSASFVKKQLELFCGVQAMHGAHTTHTLSSRLSMDSAGLFCCAPVLALSLATSFLGWSVLAVTWSAASERRQCKNPSPWFLTVKQCLSVAADNGTTRSL